jgi:tRNA-dihydrouridine synthase 1
MPPSALLSQLAFRMLARRYGAELCYTPMMSARKMLESACYRNQNLDLQCPEDRPLIVQVSPITPHSRYWLHCVRPAPTCVCT